MPTALRSPVMPSFMWTSPRAMSKAPIRIPSASSWTRDVSPARIGTSSCCGQALELEQVAVGDRLLEPVVVELAEDLARRERLRVRVHPGRVLHQREVVADGLARRAEARDVAVEAVPELDLEAVIALRLALGFASLKTCSGVGSMLRAVA